MQKILSGGIEVMRAEEEWQRAGAYSVRVQGMNRQHHIALREEFDEHDGDGTRYIVLLDDGYPFATCRFYPIGDGCVMLGRVVVLPEYRGKQYGKEVVLQAESWISVEFYRKLGYQIVDETIVKSGAFDCVRMRKEILGKD